jgi:hypothetical protein
MIPPILDAIMRSNEDILPHFSGPRIVDNHEKLEKTEVGHSNAGIQRKVGRTRSVTRHDILRLLK